MADIRFVSGQILFDGGAIAMSDDCCCEEPCDLNNYCPTCFEEDKSPEIITVSFSGIALCPLPDPDCTVYNTGTYVLTQFTNCEWRWSGSGSRLITYRMNVAGTSNLRANIGMNFCFNGVVETTTCFDFDGSNNVFDDISDCAGLGPAGYNGTASVSHCGTFL